MRQVVIRRGNIRLEDVPEPVAQRGFVLVDVAYSLISSGTEMSNLARSKKSLLQRAIDEPYKVSLVLEHLRRRGVQKTLDSIRSKISLTTPPGYSCSGTVVQVGQGVLTFRPGDVVACAGAGFASHAEFVSVPKNLVVKVPERCSLRAASSVTLGAIAMQGVRRASPCLGETVAVVGLGLLGQITVQLLRASGCRVIAFDPNDRRVALARSLGAEVAVSPLTSEPTVVAGQITEDRGVDATIITAASKSNDVVQHAMEITRRKGRVVVVGDVGLDLQRKPFYDKELDLLISCSYGPGRYDTNYELEGCDYPYAYVRWTENRNMEAYLHLVSEGAISVDAVVDKELPLSQAADAYALLHSRVERPLGIVLNYSEPDRGRARSEAMVRKLLVRSPKSARIRVAVVGGGSFASSVHLPSLVSLRSDFCLRAIMSGNPANASNLAQRFGAEYATAEYTRILEDDDIDAVIITSRHSCHSEQAIAALNAGKDVYCEKPLAVTEEQLAKILEFYDLTAAQCWERDSDETTFQQNLTGSGPPILMVGFNRRFSVIGREMKRWVEGRTSPLHMVYRVRAGKLPLDHWTLRQDEGGRVVGEMCHMIDFFEYLVGALPISCSGEIVGTPRGDSGADEGGGVSIRYSDGSVCSLIYSSVGSDLISKEYAEVSFDRSTAILDDFRRATLLSSRKREVGHRVPEKGHKQALHAFGECVRDRKGWPMDLKSVARTTLLTIRLVSSGQAVALRG